MTVVQSFSSFRSHLAQVIVPLRVTSAALAPTVRANTATTDRTSAHSVFIGASLVWKRLAACRRVHRALTHPPVMPTLASISAGTAGRNGVGGNFPNLPRLRHVGNVRREIG